MSAPTGLRKFEQGEILFNEGDQSESLFIIQKGQVRLYKPKGKGFVELAVLRSGEVIGEMAFFDEENVGAKKRSSSASALTELEVIEISYDAFGKTMQSLNPWFKTIINTLVYRLKKTNSRVKELEDNQMTNYGNTPGYEFLKPLEVMRILGTLFLVFKAHGESKKETWTVNKKTMTMYTQDLYQIMEVKLESVISILVELGWMEVQLDENKESNILVLNNVVQIRQIFLYFGTERHLEDKKKLIISEKSEQIMGLMLREGEKLLKDIGPQRTIDDAPPKFTKYFNLTPIIQELKLKRLDLDGSNVGIFGEQTSGDGETMIEVDFPKLQKLYPVVQFMNAIKRLNQQKTGGA